MADDEILIEGARQHNLQGITVRIPHRKMTVLTGVSGSGKSSLAFDTLFAEGQRRYVESLSAYARQFIGQMERPAYERIKGLSPTIAVSAGTGGASPRSTVGTITEIHDFLRVLYARLGTQHCPTCQLEVGRHDPDRIRREMAALPEGTRFTILAPLARRQPGDQRELLEQAFRDGYSRVRVDGRLWPLGEVPRLRPELPHDIELVVDRLVVRPGNEARITDSLETALRAGSGEAVVELEGGEERRYSEHLICPWCRRTFPDLTPASFSFNGPQGCCPRCRGLGRVLHIDPARVVPDPQRSLRDGAIQAPGFGRVGKGGITHDWLAEAAVALGIDLDTPWRDLPEEARQAILEGRGDERAAAGDAELLSPPEGWGEEPEDADEEPAGNGDGPPGEERPPRASGHDDRKKQKKTKAAKPEETPRYRRTDPLQRWEGVCPTLLRRMKETTSEAARQAYQSFLVDAACPDCQGTRLRPESRAVRLAGKSLPELERLPADEAIGFLDGLVLPAPDAQVAGELLRELRSRLRCLVELGLGYLTLDRAGPTLSGGEAQRIRLAGQLGGDLSGVTYVLDEPSTGLHPVDGDRLIAALHALRDAGNTVVVVEHDEAIIRAADHVIDFGPGAGEAGGRIVAAGTVEEVASSPDSLTGAYLAGRRSIGAGGRTGRRPPPRRWLRLSGARGHNLQRVELAIPLGRLVAVSGVSGAGKSTLIAQTLYPALAARLQGATVEPQPFDRLEGTDGLDKVVQIDQQPIGRSPRSTAATYTGAYELIRDLFAGTPEARAYGFGPRRFSFNAPGGRCEACRGAGFSRVEMHFLPDVQVRCEVCQGQRFNEATLRVRYRGLSIAQVLELSCADAAALFAAHPALSRILGTLREVGLGYLRLGQPASTLSGGEAQRVKLARELARPEQGRTIYLLDEPSRGLHPEDLARLLEVLDRLVEHGNTVLVVEHQLDVLRRADHLIDLGPGGGRAGGRIVAAGTPAEVARCPDSITGRFLAARRP